MYLSIKNRAIVAALRKEGKTEEANAIVNEWHSDLAAEYPAVPIAQRKIKEELEQLEKKASK